MKFLVDEMPFFKTDCPFCEDGYKETTCKCGQEHKCEYFENHRDPHFCPHLKSLEYGLDNN